MLHRTVVLTKNVIIQLGDDPRLKQIKRGFCFIHPSIKLVRINAYVKLVSKLIQPTQWLALILMSVQVKCREMFHRG